MKAVRPGMLIGTELRPTPRGGDGAPLRVRPAWWRELRERPDPVAARRAWGAYAGPITGGARTVDGVDLVEVTFLARAAPGRSIMLHLNTLTDRHRADMRPALMERAGGTRLLGLTVLLAADGVLGYRLADITGLPRDVGATRSGWKGVHERGRPDPANPERMPTPLGGAASVWRGPRAPWARWPAGPEPEWIGAVTAGGRPVRVLPGDERVVVLLDGQFLAGLKLAAAARERGLGHTLVRVDCGGPEERAGLLTDPGASAGLVRGALEAAGGVLGRRVGPARAVAGQSFGGLAVGRLLAERPDLLRAGIVQSGSFWHGRAAPGPGGPDAAGGPGDLVRLLRSGGGDVSRPVVVQAGAEEDQIVVHARRYRDALLARGAKMGYREIRGGHDYAWWRHGILDALVELEDGGH